MIQQDKGGALFPLGTGFFVASEGHLYLVTCRHVITRAMRERSFSQDEDLDQRSEALFLRLRSREDQGFRDYRVPLFDSSGKRKWRSFLSPENDWDVAIIELDRESLFAFDIISWAEEDFLPTNSDLAPGTGVFLFSYPDGFGDGLVPYDVLAYIDLANHQVFASSRGAVITIPLYPGASGSIVYKALDPSFSNTEQEKATALNNRIQLVGIFTGACPVENPMGGHFHYIDTAAAIMHSEQDCLDESGLSFRE